ncbi:NAD(P)-dependent oxidoreductase [Compostibacter hankyongensis]|uniref:2-hydroxyacid dehydrogenase n=1 Tax=Compostibacter hankyongensis TaxID=1007089 RepID=A0ABP8FWU8_9BACT
MKVVFFNAFSYDRSCFDCGSGHEFIFVRERLDEVSAGKTAGSEAVCVSPDDILNDAVLKKLSAMQVKLVMVRSSGFDNVDFKAAAEYGLTVKWLPGYSPHAIAEHAAALLLALNRKVHLAFERVKKGDFSIEGLLGFNLYGKTAGIIGMGRIGCVLSEIMKGFGCTVLAHDAERKTVSGGPDVRYVSLRELLEQSDIISLHCSLNGSTDRMINEVTLRSVKTGTLLINTARGRLVDTRAVLEALKTGRLGGYGADVYEHENMLSHHPSQTLDEIGDPLLKELINTPGVLLTPHQAFLTRESMNQLSHTIINELTFYEGVHRGTGRLII